MERVGLGLLLLLTLAGLSACDNQSSEGSSASRSDGISFAAQIQPILNATCVQCHAQELPQAGLVLEEGEAFAMLVEAPSGQSSMLLVKPGAPEESYLVHKLKNTHAESGGFGLGMPLTEGVFTPLPAENIALIESWIRDGAKAE